MLKLQCNIFIYFNLIFCPQLMLRKSLKTNKNPIIFNFKPSIKEFSFMSIFYSHWGWCGSNHYNLCKSISLPKIYYFCTGTNTVFFWRCQIEFLKATWSTSWEYFCTTDSGIRIQIVNSDPVLANYSVFCDSVHIRYRFPSLQVNM